MSLMALSFLRSLLRSVCVVVFRLFLLFVLSFVFVFLVDIHLYILSLLCPFLAMMSFAGNLLVYFFYLISLHFFSEHVHGLIWFGSVYFVTTAEFVADQLI